MKIVNQTLGWVIGLIFLVIGIDAISESFLGGLSFIIIAFLIIPLARTVDFYFLGKEIPLWIRGTATALLMVTFTVFMTSSKQEKSEQLKAQLAEVTKTQNQRGKKTVNKRRNTYQQQVASNRQNTVTSQPSFKLTAAQPASKPVTSTTTNTVVKARNDNEVSKRNALLTKQILKELKEIPASKYKENRDLYQDLVSLNPDNSKYKKKLTYYNAKLSEVASNDSINAKRTDEILNQLKEIPVSQYLTNKKLYEELVTLNPDNKKYQDKVEFYASKIAQNSTAANQTSCDNLPSEDDFQNTTAWLAEHGHCLTKAQKNNLEKKLLSRVKKIPKQQTRENRDGYKALVILDPDNVTYIRKLNTYERSLRVSSN